MRSFLFKLFFKFTWWLAPDKPRVNKIFELYLEYIKAEEDFKKCQERQAEMDACVQPRTETYEHLTCEKQRKTYESAMPHRIAEDARRERYTDYDERNYETIVS